MPESLAHVQEFLRLLGDRGMLRGVDRRLRVELLLREMGIPDDPRELHDLLVPVIARNPEEQSRFRELFDGFFVTGARPGRRSSTGLPIPPVPPPPPPPRRWWAVSIVAGAVMVLAVLFLVSRPRPEKVDDKVVSRADTAPRTPPPENTRVAPPRAAVRRDTLEDADSGLVASPVAQSGIPGRIVGLSFLSAALLGLPMFLAARGTRRRRSRARAADAERKEKAPFVYVPRPPKPRLFTSAEFYDAARAALRRQRMEGRRISVERSLAATIDAGGLPTLRFEPASRPPEYLVLIERMSAGDHQALLFDSMVQRLRQEGMMYVERFFFERDPRWCRSESQGAVSLDELQRRYHEHRLVILGDGAGLLDERGAELAPWTAVFEGWVERAVLTARPMATWGAPEEALAARFVVLPATAVGLRGIVESFELEARPDLRQWREVEGKSRRLPRRATGVAELRATLDPAVWRWVCACAVYPNLHWALTLYLGTLRELGAGQLLHEEHLLGLVALPWFREGFIPHEVRAELVDDLDEATERAVRRAIANVLALDVPDPASAAGRWHEAQMLVQGVLANPDDPEIRAALARRVRELPRALLLRDPAATRRLRAVRHTPLDRLLPHRARRLVYRDGISLFGKRPWTRRSAGTAVVLLAAVGPSYLFMKRDQPTGQVASFAAPLAVRIQVGRLVAFTVVPRDARRQPLALPVTWAVADSAIAGANPVVGRAVGTTSVIVAAGGSEARIPVTVVAEDRTATFPVELTSPAKQLRVGEVAKLSDNPVLIATCDPGVATADNSNRVDSHRAGSTRLISAHRDLTLRIRELKVIPSSPTATSALTEPVTFPAGFVTPSQSAQAVMDRKSTRLRSDSARAIVMESHASAADSATSLQRARLDFVRAYLAKAGVSPDQIQIASTVRHDWMGDNRCDPPPQSYVAFAEATVRPGATSSTPPKRPPASPRVVATRPPTRRIPISKPEPGSDSNSIRIPTTKGEVAPNIDPAAKQAYNLPNQAQQRLPAPDATPYSIDSAGVPHGVSTAARGDSGEARAWADARVRLRQQRRLRSSTIGFKSDFPRTAETMPASSYAFVTPRELFRVPPEEQDLLLPIHPNAIDSYDFEIHKVGGSVFLVGFASPTTVAMLQRGYLDRGGIDLYATGGASATCPVEVPVADVHAQSFQSTPLPVIHLAVEPRSKEQPYVPRGVSGCSFPASKK